MRHIIIGTAGHIDHGKTALIKALTGRNTDRWEEEQKRGITIDLGFTWLDLPDGSRAGIIDVPGHERFIHNMVAGVAGMDMVLLVIAADEGIMPQTREHMDILELLGVKNCIIVLTKCDLVEEDFLNLVKEEIRENFKGTFLEKAPVVTVSSVTGYGLDELVSQIMKMAGENVTPKDTKTIFRLPVDRAFTIAGHGTVVTGTLLSGTIRKEDTVEIYPTGRQSRVRTIQVHSQDQKEAYAGQRVALNLAGVKRREVERGCVIAPIGSMHNTSLLDVRLHILKSSQRILTNRMRLHLYTGTSELLCRVILLDADEIGPGETGYVQLRLEQEVAVRKGDRFVVRFYSPLETIGGGVVLEPNPAPKRRHKAAAIEELRRKEKGSPADVVEMHIRSHASSMITVAQLAVVTGRTVDEVLEDVDFLWEDGRVEVYPMQKETFVWPKDYCLLQLEELIRHLKMYEKQHPYRQGVGRSQVRSAWYASLEPELFAAVTGRWEKEGRIDRHGEYLCTSGHTVPHDELYHRVHSAMNDAFSRAGYEFVKYKEVPCGSIRPETRDDLMVYLTQEGEYVRLDDDTYAFRKDMEKAAEIVAQMVQDKPIITMGDVRDRFSTSRRCAKLILAYTDDQKITRSAGPVIEWKKY